ncbi:(2Fe-2S) ferredoxin domain-containing protein [Acaryochloris sp. IP29b_bin.137]|uniref:(2Fe-2S) ferredoxin domain-containing protein n=1 Tax=Acaryochloris sp. IP29b_bin.137 TaxID=2969217 RepID=UPI0026189F15|nr:(2Fe-2S) ferredoxin domain-containing protein [Acaryochloris sp. IP29b_bin.137]
MSTTPPWIFNLEGTFLGFFGNDPDQPKSLLLEVEEEEIPIKLPKPLRASLRQRLKLGDRICCIGRSQIHGEAGVIKLQAYTLFSLPPHSGGRSGPCPPSPPAVSHIGLTHNPKLECPLDQPQRKRAKILVCKKSGCQKQGGYQLMAALEGLLQAHQLQDQVEIQYSGCQKRCSKAPSLTVMPGKHRYERLTPERLMTIIQTHFCVSEPHSLSHHVD